MLIIVLFDLKLRVWLRCVFCGFGIIYKLVFYDVVLLYLFKVFFLIIYSVDRDYFVKFYLIIF